MKLDTKKLKRKIDDYFANITKEELRRDLIKAGSEVYSSVGFNILDTEEEKIQTKVEDFTFSMNEATNAFYSIKYAAIGINLLFAEAIRPRYALRKSNMESSNQECNLIGAIRSKKIILQSSAEDSLPGGDQYGYI